MQMKSVEKYRIMGIDPGTNYMGYGVLEIEGRTVRSVVLGDIDLHKLPDPYAKLRYIFERVGALVDEYAPREVALESPFFGENVQSMLKLGRAQGVAMAAALSRGIDVFEYAPMRIKPPSQAARCHGRHGRRSVPLLHLGQSAQRRAGRRTRQGAWRRQKSRLEGRLAELGAIPEKESRPGDQIKPTPTYPPP